MRGFNFKTKEIKMMHDYLVKTEYLDFDEVFLNHKLNEGMNNLEQFFNEYLSNMVDNLDYHFILNIIAEEPLVFEDAMSIFGMFAYVLSKKSSIENDKGYLASPKEMAMKIAIPNFTGIYIMNHEYDLGTIQLTIMEKDGALIRWVR
jgi:hypothetical protein